MKHVIRLFALLLGAVPAFAQDEFERSTAYADSVVACAESASAGTLGMCRNQAQASCLEAEGDQSMFGFVFCTDAEVNGWERVVERLYQEHLGDMTQMDQAYPPGRPDLSRAAWAGAAQHSWEAWRDAECMMHYAMWQGGTIRGVEAIQCRLDLTAARAIQLRQLQEPER